MASASSSKVALGAAGLAALCGGTAFLSAGPAGNQVSLASRSAGVQQVDAGVSATATASASFSGVAATAALATGAVLAAAGTSARRAAGSARHQLVATHAFEAELGVQAPVGFWDPAGYTSDGDVQKFKRRRETEIKHGRVAMYAAMGYITPEYFKWPGYLSPSTGLKFADVPNGLAAISKVPTFGWTQIVAFAGYYELFVYKYTGTPGAYGWKLLTSSTPEGLKNKLNAELANGRLAMMAIIGMFFQDGLTGSAWGDWQFYTDSPLR